MFEYKIELYYKNIRIIEQFLKNGGIEEIKDFEQRQDVKKNLLNTIQLLKDKIKLLESKLNKKD